MKHMIFAALLVVGLANLAFADDVAITVYNQNLALVKEGRTLDFQKGVNQMKLTDVAAYIDPTSVHFKLKAGGNDVRLLEQNYQYDLISSDKILQKYLGNDIDVIMKNGDVLHGKYLSSSSGYIVLQLSESAIRLINDKEMLSVTAPKLPEGLIVVPTLEWLLASDIAGKRDVEVSYLTDNINWHAEYVALIDATDTKLQLSGWVSLDNKSGKTYRDAKLKLVAGDINRVQPPRQTMYGKGMRAEMAMDAAGFEEKAFFEYHMYTLGRPTTVANNEVKQVSLFDPASTPIKKLYRYAASDGAKDVNVVITFKNSEANGLGMPLPAGKVRLTKLDTDGSEEFLGEDQIDHTPKDEEVELKVGNAFDVVGETATLDSKRITDRVAELTVEVKLRNHKKEDVTVSVLYNIWGDWQVLENSFPWTKKNARQAEFTVPVAKDSEAVLRFRVRVTN